MTIRRPKVTAAEVVCADRLQASALRLLRLLRKMDLETGVRGGALGVLSQLAYEGTATVGELARSQQVRSPTMTELVSQLEHSGFVTREMDAGDRRRVRVGITADGRRELNDWRSRRVRPLATLLQALPARQTEGIDRSFALVERVLQEALRDTRARPPVRKKRS